ncbi:receptor-type tyrosine-protein phosphatase epsilon-like isoform X2 [Ornithodoros turicata]|uniref:receptor-type tyrosine-protein phosphatase epsilon-like isoform X2 n=1 Tax=Ornithodoros turicata TaxID=34597 RepID=UPI00313A0986
MFRIHAGALLTIVLYLLQTCLQLNISLVHSYNAELLNTSRPYSAVLRNTSILWYDLKSLLPGCSYNVCIQASTVAGFGPPQCREVSTKASVSPWADIETTVAVVVSVLLILAISATALYYRSRRKRNLSIERETSVAPFSANQLLDIPSAGYVDCAPEAEEYVAVDAPQRKGTSVTLILVQQFRSHVINAEANGRLKEEFMVIDSGELHPCEAAKRPENMHKNRYGNVLPYDHSRVILSELPDGGSDYINANYVAGYNNDRRYIATQGPTLGTVTDFWRMVWGSGSCKIVMLTNLVEQKVVKCVKYWPDSVEQYSDIEVRLHHTDTTDDFVIREFAMSREKERRHLLQFHFTSWPEHGVPACLDATCSFMKRELNRPIYRSNETYKSALSNENVGKNQTRDVLAGDSKRFLLCPPQGSGRTDYINAVYVDGYRSCNAFLVTQFPRPDTVGDFWQMVSTSKTTTIVTLDNLHPGDKNCPQFWPEVHQTLRSYGCSVCNIATTVNSAIVVRTFRVEQNEQPPRAVRQFHLQRWPRSAPVPPSCDVILNIIQQVQDWQSRLPNAVLVIQCTDGCLASGLFCASSIIWKRMNTEQMVDVFQSVQTIRRSRTEFVRELVQYQFCYDVALAFLDKLSTYANLQ